MFRFSVSSHPLKFTEQNSFSTLPLLVIEPTFLGRPARSVVTIPTEPVSNYAWCRTQTVELLSRRSNVLHSLVIPVSEVSLTHCTRRCRVQTSVGLSAGSSTFSRFMTTFPSVALPTVYLELKQEVTLSLCHTTSMYEEVEV
jgi:hypothetical protein